MGDLSSFYAFIIFLHNDWKNYKNHLSCPFSSGFVIKKSGDACRKNNLKVFDKPITFEYNRNRKAGIELVQDIFLQR